jgi:putative DNA primase/helicase
VAARQARIEEQIAALLDNRHRNAHNRNVLDPIRLSPNTRRIVCEPQLAYITVRNGMVDWRTGDLLEHSPDYLSTVQLPVEYHKECARCPKFDKFLAEVLREDCLQFIWEVIGYAMYSGNPFDVAILLYGIGRNGKGTLIRVLKAPLGEETCSAVGLHDLVQNRFRAATLYGKLANLAGDLDARWIVNTAGL